MKRIHVKAFCIVLYSHLFPIALMTSIVRCLFFFLPLISTSNSETSIDLGWVIIRPIEQQFWNRLIWSCINMRRPIMLALLNIYFICICCELYRPNIYIYIFYNILIRVQTIGWAIDKEREIGESIFQNRNVFAYKLFVKMPVFPI